MEIRALVDSNLYLWFILPLMIFLARIFDVSLQTLRIVFVSKGWKYLTPFVGFFEVTIWLLAIRAVMQHLNNAACFFAYGAGFAAGSYVGIMIEQKLALGRAVLQIITRKEASQLIEHLNAKGYGLTHIDAQGHRGKVKIIYMIIKRKVAPELTKEIQKFNPNAFYTLEDVQFVSEGIFPKELNRGSSDFKSRLTWLWRKGK